MITGTGSLIIDAVASRNWAATVGKSAPPADGAAAKLFVFERLARQLNARPCVRLRSFLAGTDDVDFVLPDPMNGKRAGAQEVGQGHRAHRTLRDHRNLCDGTPGLACGRGRQTRIPQPTQRGYRVRAPTWSWGPATDDDDPECSRGPRGRLSFRAAGEAGGEANATIPEQILNRQSKGF